MFENENLAALKSTTKGDEKGGSDDVDSVDRHPQTLCVGGLVLNMWNLANDGNDEKDDSALSGQGEDVVVVLNNTVFNLVRRWGIHASDEWHISLRPGCDMYCFQSLYVYSVVLTSLTSSTNPICTYTTPLFKPI